MTNKVTMRLLTRVETSLTTETMTMIIAGAIIRTSIMTAIIWVVVSMGITNATKAGHTTKLVVAMISGTTTIMMTTGAITLAAVATATVVAEVAMVRAASNLTPASKAVVKEAKTVISKCKESTVVSTAAIITIINAIRAATVATKAVAKEAKTNGTIIRTNGKTIKTNGMTTTATDAISTWVVRMTRTAAIGGTKMTAKVCRTMAVKANMAIADI